MIFLYFYKLTAPEITSVFPIIHQYKNQLSNWGLTIKDCF